MVKKVSIFCIIISVIFSISGCGSKPGAEIYIKDEDYVTDKDFLDDDTYQVIGNGTWPDDYADKGQIEKSRKAKENALSDAQKKIMEVFRDCALKVKGRIESDTGLDEETLRKIKGYGKGGSIVKTSYDEEFNCSLVYRVCIKGLKKMVEAGFSEVE